MTIDEVLTQLGTRLGLMLKLDSQNCCRLVFDGEVDVDLEVPADDRSRLFLHTVVGNVPSLGRETFYETLLDANRFGSGVGAAVLSVDPMRQEVLLHRALALDALGVDEITAALEDFVARTVSWTERVRDFRPLSPIERPTDADLPMIRI
jgi:hypothetical protein